MLTDLTLCGRSPRDGSLQTIVLNEEGIHKIIRIELEDRLKGKIRSWKKQGTVDYSKVYGVLYGLQLSVDPRYEGFAKTVLYPLAEEILEKHSFQKKEDIWRYHKP